MYSLHDITYQGKPARIIAVTLIEYSHDTPGWGYKPMDETMGPYRFNCPARILDAATEPLNDCARDWREACRGKRTARFGVAS